MMHSQVKLSTTHPLAYQNEIKFVIIMPGQIGVRISALKNNWRYSEQFKSALLNKVIGMQAVDINPLTGSVLIHYHSDKFTKNSYRQFTKIIVEFFPQIEAEKLHASLS